MKRVFVEEVSTDRRCWLAWWMVPNGLAPLEKRFATNCHLWGRFVWYLEATVLFLYLDRAL